MHIDAHTCTHMHMYIHAHTCTYVVRAALAVTFLRLLRNPFTYESLVYSPVLKFIASDFPPITKQLISR